MTDRYNILLLLRKPIELPVDIVKYIFERFIWGPWMRLLKFTYYNYVYNIRRHVYPRVYGPGFGEDDYLYYEGHLPSYLLLRPAYVPGSLAP